MSTSGQKLDDPSVMEVTGKILIATIVALFLVLVLVFCFHLYAKWLWHRRQQGVDGHNHRRQQQQQQHSGVTVLRRGLDASFLKTIPVVELDPKHLKEGLECAVCLSELQEGEKSRILPKCSHVFHAECIDMWFHSHATCPICRNPVSEQTEKVSVESLLEEVEESRNMNGGGGGGDFPTNMLFWGDETEVSTLTSQLDQETQDLEASSSSSSSSSEETNNNDRAKPDLVIDIPSSRQHEGEDEKTPVLSRMQSLRRMLSSGSRFNPFSPNNAQQTNH